MGNKVTGRASVSTHANSGNGNSELWHKWLGHLSEGGMLELHKCKLLQGVKSCKLDFCKFCVLRKHKRVSFKASSHTSKGVLDYVHSDVWGPIMRVLNEGAHYSVTFIDDFSRKVWVCFMKHKSEVFNVFKQWKARVKNQTDDMLIATKSKYHILHLKKMLSMEFDMKDHSFVKKILGVEINRAQKAGKLWRKMLSICLEYGTQMQFVVSCEVFGFVDSDYAGDLDSRRSTIGYIFTFIGGPICWKSVLQSTIALSITEAEYMSLTEVAKEALWLKRLVEELGFKQRGVLL
ncbi:hypothetical protein RJ639_023744 [Escallonia herrerae]|uniref:GAG-pre-integrase domain-containing protein n=1 Tax=Escallonia herrerae TaxID=1293975 RepID=A0AA88V3S1_9ASTE|nr:hypothetical protein RJ639_023744 [Escallonia herrerae]